ncbi:MAG: isomerase/hydrolase, partial [Calditrichaeota bacterium]
MKNITFVSSDRTLRVNNIFCVGRNYAAHAAELNNPIPKAPIIFLKPTSSIIYNGDTILLPPQSQDVHHEVEVLVVIGKSGKNIAPENALEHVAGYGIGLDIT